MPRFLRPDPSSRAMRQVKRLFFTLLALSILLGFAIVFLELSGVLAPDIGENVIAAREKENFGGQEDFEGREDFSGAEQGAAEEPEPAEEKEDDGIIRRTINTGDTASALLQEWLSVEDANQVVAVCKDVYSLQNLRAGQPYMVLQDENGFSRFEYEIDGEKKLVVCRDASDFTATLEDIQYDVRLEKVEGTIESSIFESMPKIGETPFLAVRLAQIFAWEINFIKDVQTDDSFSVLIEKRYLNGEFKGYGKLLAATFVNQGKTFESFMFADSSGNVEYYNSKGESVKRAFLKAPLSFTRISSRFSLSRLHPIYKTWRAHPAIDYAAPTGTPVKAIGGGVVTFSGWGRGAGNYVALKHHGGYESMYLHLSRFANRIKKGARVRQGEIIGYVGSTGASTGPHLDFRMKKGGEWVNPNKVTAPRAEAINAKTMGSFMAQRDLYRLYLNGAKRLADYTPAKEQAHP